MTSYKLIHNDRLKLLNKLKNNSVQLIITSPPYNIGKSYEKKKPFENYLKEQEKTLKECFRVLKKSGSLCWRVGSYFENSELFHWIFIFIKYVKK